MELNYAIAAGLIIVTLFYFYIMHNIGGANKKKLPPEASGGWPFIGHLRLLGGRSATTLPHVVLGSMADKYGPIFTIRVGIHPTVVVSSPELVKELFTTNDLAVSYRPEMVAAKHLSYNFALFGFSPYGEYWRWVRKCISMELLSSLRLDVLSYVRASETTRTINELYALWIKKKDGSGRMLVDMKQLIGDLNLNVVMRMVVGKRFYGSGTEGEEALRCREVMKEFFYSLGLFVAADALPFLGWLDLGGYEKKMKETASKLDEIVGGWLAERRREKDSGKDGGGEDRDFMEVLLSIVKDDDTRGPYDADTIIKAMCLSMIAGGSDSPLIVLTWAFSLLLNNRHVLKNLQEELDTQIGKDRRVNESDINNLTYLQAVIKETLRLYPVIPLNHRKFNEDCEIGGYHISRGTRLMVNMWKLQRDPNIWSQDPLEFKPERFLTAHENVDVKGQNFELIPFGAGRRICPGMNFGLEMVHLALANFLHGFEFSTQHNELVDMSESAGLTNNKATPLNVHVAPRLSPNMYY